MAKERASSTLQTDWVFTFGSDHTHPKRQGNLLKCYVQLRGTSEEARDQMFSVFGNKWAFQYRHDDEAQEMIERLGLTRVDLMTGEDVDEWKAGDRLSHKSSRLWHDETGEKHEDWALVEGRVTKVEEHVVYWILENVVHVHKMCPGTDLYQVVPTSGGFVKDPKVKLPWIKRLGPKEVVPQWKAEHGESYDVPEQITTHPGLIDSSWHNDTCPAFALCGDVYTLWVDHPDPEQREMEGARYTVYDHCEDHQLYAGEDIDQALAIVNGLLTDMPPTDRDRIMTDFEVKVMDLLDKAIFTEDEKVGMRSALTSYREYRAANTYQGDPIGREGEPIGRDS